MLNELTLRNFRAFKNQSFSFGKINIFVGPNNSGKSSAISAINLLAQTFADDDISQSPLVLNGQFDQLGTYLDLVHGNRSNTPLGMDIGFAGYTAKFDYKYRQQRREIELVRFELEEKRKTVYSYSSRKDSFSSKTFGIELDHLIPQMRKRRPLFYKLLPNVRFVSATYDQEMSSSVSRESRDLLISAERSLSRARTQIRRIFSDFDSISPFRDRPQRTYLYSGEVAQRIGTTGSNMAMMLANDTSKRGAASKDVLTEASRWFRVSGIADEIRVKSLTPRHFELVLAENGSEHNICDVGFGCSQVLPVLVAALNMFGQRNAALTFRQPILVVQEPEIHLHPNAQASLGSFFTGLLQSTGQLFIETHSDNLVLRIARHVADGSLSPDDVKIFYVHKKNGASVVEKINVSSEGRFEPSWPGGFFPQRQSESLSLARAAHRASKDPVAQQLEFKYPEES